jgi:membrane protease YdiL (CAAX protease family)
MRDAGVRRTGPSESMAERLTDGTSKKNVERLWPLGIFFCLAAGSTWVAWLWPVEIHGQLPLSILGLEIKIPFLLMKLVIGNCLPGILAVVWVWFEGKGQFQRLLSTLTKWRAPLHWYIIGVALPSAVFLVAWNAVLTFFPVDHLPLSLGRFVSTFLLTLPFGPLWEELAWRAFALRKLESRYSRLASALILGAYWALWHIPLWLMIFSWNRVYAIPALLAASGNLVAWSVIWAYFYHRTSESLPVVILLHAMYGAVWNELFAALPLTQFIYVSSALAVCVTPFFARGLVRFRDEQCGGGVVNEPVLKQS